MANVTLIDGHVPNYVDPETKVPRFLGVQTALTMLALIVVALRVYTRKFIHNIFSTEDWVAVGSMVSQLINGNSKAPSLTALLL